MNPIARAEVRQPFTVSRREYDKLVPLSYQQAMWWESEHRGSVGYRLATTGQLISNTYAGLRLDGRFDPDAFQRSLDQVARRHDTLRTRFEVVDGRPMQAFAPAAPVPVELIDLSSTPVLRREDELNAAATGVALRPFDYTSGTFLKAAVLRLAPTQHVAFVVVPHIVSDALSMKILIDEILTLYLHFSKGLPSPLPELTVRYADFVFWQQEWVRGEMRTGAGEYIRKRLRHAVPLILPQRVTDEAEKSSEAAMGAFAVPADLAARLYRVGMDLRVTPFMIVLSAFNLLLSLWSGHTDVLQIVPFGGRPDVGTTRLIGLFSNLCPLRTDMSGDPTFTDVLDRVRQTVADALTHRYVPYGVLAEIAREQGDELPPLAVGMNSLFERGDLVPRSCLPLLDTITQVQPYVLDIAPAFARRQTKGDLSLWVKFAGDGAISGTLIYRRCSFSEATIRDVADGFVRLLAAVVDEPSRRGSRLRVALPRTDEAVATCVSSRRI